MDILEKATQAFSKVHYTHLTLYYQASVTNDPNKAKSIVELSQLPSDSCSLLTAEFYLKICQKKKKVHHPSFCCKLAVKQPDFNPFPFICILFALGACESCPLLCTHPDPKTPRPSAPGCLWTARLSKGKLWTYVERCVSDLEAS